MVRRDVSSVRSGSKGAVCSGSRRPSASELAKRPPPVNSYDVQHSSRLPELVEESPALAGRKSWAPNARPRTMTVSTPTSNVICGRAHRGNESVSEAAASLPLGKPAPRRRKSSGDGRVNRLEQVVHHVQHKVRQQSAVPSSTR